MEINERKQLLKKRILPTLLISLIIPIMLCVCIPFEIYANNSQEFLFSMADFLPICILIGFVIAIILFFAIFFLPEKLYKIACAVIISFSVMFFVQSLYLNAGLKSLVGDTLETNELSTGKKFGNLIIWIFIIAGAIVLSILKDKKGYISIVGIILSVVVIITQIMTPVSLMISKPEVLKSKVNGKSGELIDYGILTTKNLTNISTSNNIFYFFIDKFDGRFAEQTYESKPEVFSELTGFTWFKDHVSRYSHTYPSVSTMLTRNEYDPTKSRAEFLEDVYAEDDTLSVLHENGYEINLYTEEFYVYDKAEHLPEFVNNVSLKSNYKINNRFKLSARMIQMALYRVVPLFFKNLVGGITSSVCNSYIDLIDPENNSLYSSDLDDTYNVIKETGFKKIDEKQFTFIHVQGCHDVEPDMDCIPTMEKNFKIINEYIKAMKEYGVYEDATIVITGDHATAYGGYQQTTALMVKPSGVSTGEMAVSMAQTSHDNIWATIMKSENIVTGNDYGKSVFEIVEGENQTRYYSWHTWNEKLVEYNYTITGAARDLSKWELTSTREFDKTLMD